MIDFFVLFIIGCLAGIFAGLFGIGGGVIVTPSLIFYLKYMNLPEDLIFRLSFGTSLFVIIFASVSSFIKHYRIGNVVTSAIVSLGIFSVIGGVAGSFLASYLPAAILGKVFCLILFFVSVRLFFEINTDENKMISGKLIYLIPTGILAGTVGSIAGLGGGIILIPAMIMILKCPVKKVAGTSSGVIIFISIAATISYIVNGLSVSNLPELSVGYVNIKAALPILAGTILFAPFGAVLNSKIKSTLLRKMFAVFILLTAIKIAFL